MSMKLVTVLACLVERETLLLPLPSSWDRVMYSDIIYDGMWTAVPFRGDSLLGIAVDCPRFCTSRCETSPWSSAAKGYFSDPRTAEWRPFAKRKETQRERAAAFVGFIFSGLWPKWESWKGLMTLETPLCSIDNVNIMDLTDTESVNCLLHWMPSAPPRDRAKTDQMHKNP